MSKKDKQRSKAGRFEVRTPGAMTVGESLSALSAVERDRSISAPSMPDLFGAYAPQPPITVEAIASAVVDELERRGYLPFTREDSAND